MKAWCDFFQLASGVIIWCAVCYICAATFCSSNQIRRRAAPCGCLVLAVFVVMLHLLSTVGAAKPRLFRDATASVWAEGMPMEISKHAMAAGPDGSLYVFGGYVTNYIPNSYKNDLFKLDLDTGEWHPITPRVGSPPSARYEHGMVAVGTDLYVFGGSSSGEEARGVCWPPSGGMADLAPTSAPRAAAVRTRPHSLGRGCWAWRHQGLVTRGEAQPL